MSILPTLMVILTTVFLNTEAAVLQSQPNSVTAPNNCAATKSHRLQNNRIRTIYNESQHYDLSHNITMTPTFRPLNSAMTDNPKKLTFQTHRFRNIRNTQIIPIGRNLSNHIISSASKGLVLHNKLRNIGTRPIRQMRSSKTDNEVSSSITALYSSTGISPNSKSAFIFSTEVLKVPKTANHLTGPFSLNTTKDDTSPPSRRNARKLDTLFFHPLQEVKTASQCTDEDTSNKCTCKQTKCIYSCCHLNSVPQDLPKSITDLLININDITNLLINSFSRYIYLETLVLSYNSMTAIEEGSFSGLSNLRYLDLSNNNLIKSDSQIAVNIFEPLKSLEILRIELNIDSCTSTYSALDTVLSYLENVEELYIDNYINTEKGEFFGPGFKNMTSLRKLNINCQTCIFVDLPNTTFIYLSNITTLDIKNCGIDGRFTEVDAFSHFRQLETLDISGNKRIGMEYLPIILCGLNSSHFQTLRMNYIVDDRSITIINKSVTQCMPKTMTTLSARGNNILLIDRRAVLTLPTSLRTIDIRDNNIFTDPEEIPVDHFVQLEMLLMSSNRGECTTNDDENGLKIIIDKARKQSPKNFRRKNKPKMLKTKFKINSVLPWTLRRVKIAVENMNDDYLRNVDEQNNLEEIDLSCSYLPELNFGNFERFPNLRTINARRSSVQILIPSLFQDILSLKTLILEGNLLNNFINNFGGPFYYLVNLLHLDLSLNQLTTLPRDIFYGLDKLEYLHLDNNSFSIFEVDISNMTQLKQLSVSNTGLSQLSGDVRAHIDQLCKVRPGQVKVDMSGCPIQCDCFNLDFLKWMVSSPAFDKNFTGYKCKYSDMSSKDIKDSYQETIHVLDRECAKNYPMFLIVLAATSVLMSTVVGAIVYRFRWKIRYLYYAAYLKVMDKHKNDNQHEFVYDVFISYDSEDHAYVTRQLASELEKRGLKLLIHGRDFVAGTYIASNIVMAVSESRKTLVVLTRNLLESSWCKYELQMATMEAAHTGRQVLVFLLKENIPNRELDVELLSHIRSNTYIPYPGLEEEGDDTVMKRFYDKLTHDLQR